MAAQQNRARVVLSGPAGKNFVGAFLYEAAQSAVRNLLMAQVLQNHNA